MPNFDFELKKLLYCYYYIVVYLQNKFGNAVKCQLGFSLVELLQTSLGTLKFNFFTFLIRRQSCKVLAFWATVDETWNNIIIGHTFPASSSQSDFAISSLSFSLSLTVVYYSVICGVSNVCVLAENNSAVRDDNN